MRKMQHVSWLAMLLSVAAVHRPAVAHAFLKSATPAVGSTLQTAPATVEIIFSSSVEPEFSSIVVQDATGVRVDKNDTHLAAGDDMRLSVSVGSLPFGTYTVIWHATSTDTHKTQGSFTFTVER